MDKILLGKTKLKVSRSGFGALPIQRISMEMATELLTLAYESGINFYDTARFYTDSEEKLGNTFKNCRNKIVIASKTGATDKNTLWEHLKTSLDKLRTDYIDIYQFHNPGFVPLPDGNDGLYNAMLEAKEKALIRHIGISSHKIDLAIQAVNSGLYDTIQFPINFLSSDNELKLIELCSKNNVGLIAMKALSGGLIQRAELSFVFLRQFDNVVPIWGFQKISELQEIIAYEKNPPFLDNKILDEIENEKKELSGDFCRGCGYCLPCPSGISINWCARMSLLLRRAPYKNFIVPEWIEKMKQIENCTSCGQCISKCPYSLELPRLLKNNLINYMDFINSIGVNT